MPGAAATAILVRPVAVRVRAFGVVPRDRSRPLLGPVDGGAAAVVRLQLAPVHDDPAGVARPRFGPMDDDEDVVARPRFGPMDDDEDEDVVDRPRVPAWAQGIGAQTRRSASRVAW